MKVNSKRYQLFLESKVAISHNTHEKSENVKLIRELCKDETIEGDSYVYWFDGKEWGSGFNPRYRSIPAYPAQWFFEPEEEDNECSLNRDEVALSVFLKLVEIDNGSVDTNIQADRAVKAADKLIGRLKSKV